ncbi:TMEM175 family protein [Oscillatoria sp. FACHB-1406]|uniref:TMEM175 family protein n=1 Tax=Oscillatoria sp. FACHB-1406 TaxID=2692846 RepID=UPI0016885EE4|nr:TMEM175 family protein [Oscillatoria sp. FACHB-1406]MBD2577647.1 DUF1211 domain-containing protein [Oscillatoria sp. FACHB-1406]
METNRLEAFSDGVFAIAITLLVLEIKVPPPSTALGAALLQLWPSYLAYVVSFLAIGAIALGCMGLNYGCSNTLSKQESISLLQAPVERCPSPAVDNLCIITDQLSAVGVHGRCCAALPTPVDFT